MGGEQILREGRQELLGLDVGVKRKEGSRRSTWEDWAALWGRWGRRGWSGRFGGGPALSEPTHSAPPRGALRAGHCLGTWSMSARFIC